MELKQYLIATNLKNREKSWKFKLLRKNLEKSLIDIKEFGILNFAYNFLKYSYSKELYFFNIISNIQLF